MSTNLKNAFINLATITSNRELATTQWNEIEEAHSNPTRFYHNLSHLENIYDHLLPIRESMENWDATIFSIVYHDFIYNSNRKDNEIRSAKIAQNRLSEINISLNTIDRCFQTITATKSHSENVIDDINLFTDADLSILGSDWNEYRTYTKAIRNEYSNYPDSEYKLGRKQVLCYFQKMKSIFKTDYFCDLLEKRAQLNIKKEIELLA